MKTGYIVLSAAIPLLLSCASHQNTANGEAWKIRPVYSVRNSTETPESFYQLGRYYQGQNRLEPALDAYQKSLSIDANFARSRNGLGVIYAMQGRQQQALEQFRQAVKLAPDAAYIQNNLGYALYLGKSYAEAAIALERAVALNPASQTAQANLALALDKAGDREKAVLVMVQAAQSQLAVQPVAQQQTAPVTTALLPPSPPLALSKDSGEIPAEAKNTPAPAEVLVRTAPQETSSTAGQRALTPAVGSYRIEVSNGNGVTGMAKKVAGFLGGEGYARARLTNQKPFHVVSSQVQYRTGYQDQAQLLALTLPSKPGIAKADNLRGDIGIRVVLGKDMIVASFEQGKLRVAQKE